MASAITAYDETNYRLYLRSDSVPCRPTTAPSPTSKPTSSSGMSSSANSGSTTALPTAVEQQQLEQRLLLQQQHRDFSSTIQSAKAKKKMLSKRMASDTDLWLSLQAHQERYTRMASMVETANKTSKPLPSSRRTWKKSKMPVKK